MGKRGYKGRGRGGRGGKSHHGAGSDFGDEFIAFDDILDVRGRGRGRGRGAFLPTSSVFVPPAGRATPRGGYRGAVPFAPRGRGNYQPRGRGDSNFRGRGRGRGDSTPRGRGDLTPRGRGRGFGYTPGGRNAGNEFGEYRNRLLEPIVFVRAELTPRTLFQEEEEIFRAEMVDLEQGDSVPTADAIEAAFAAQLDGEEDEEEELSEDGDDLQDVAAIPTKLTFDTPGSYTPPVASSSKHLPKLDISSAVTLATALKDAALTPHEERFVPVSPAMSQAIIDEATGTAPAIATPNTRPDPDSESDSDDVVLFVPQPRTPLRPLTPLPLLGAPGSAHTFGVAPSPIRPSPLATFFGPPLQEDNSTLGVIPETPKLTTEAVDVHMGAAETVRATGSQAKPLEEEIPTFNFEDLSEAMFVDTAPAPVELSSRVEGPKNLHEHILGSDTPRASPLPAAPSFHDMTFKFTSRSTTHATERAQAPSEIPSHKTAAVIPTELTSVGVSSSTPPKPPPNFHDMTFTFTPRNPASRARKPIPNGGRHGLGFQSKNAPRVSREGDSDLEWGDDGPPKSKRNGADEKEEDESDGDHGMVEDVDSATMLTFLKRVEAREWVSMDDIKDEEMLRQEDEEEESGSEESDEEEASEEDEEDFNRIIAAAEAELVDSDEDETAQFLDEDDSDDDVDGSFRTRLARMRQNTARNGKGKGKGKGKGRLEDDEDDEDEIEMSGFSWAEKDENYIISIQEKLDEELFLKRERKRGVISPPLSPASRGKNKYVPQELKAQWERDRSKKAENKRLRALQRQAAAQEAPKRGSGSKSKASFLFNNSGALPTLPALEPKLRAFAADLEARTMALQAMDKESRRRVHLLAECFGIKTASKGGGTGRYVTLTRTSRTGLMIDEARVHRLVSAADDAEDGGIAAFNRAYYRRDNVGPGKVQIKTRDGEVVGRAAAKIGGDNIGHQLLSKMGWAEGDRIGKSGGIADPLVAIMKNTKLGLGATRK